MTTAEAAFTADPRIEEEVEASLLRLMAQARDFAEECFARAKTAEAPVARATELRLACRLATLVTRTFTALDRHRDHVRRQQKETRKTQQRARFDHALQLAKLADAAVARKCKRDAAAAKAAAPPVGATSSTGGDQARPLSRQQRRAEERRRRKAERRAQGP